MSNKDEIDEACRRRDSDEKHQVEQLANFLEMQYGCIPKGESAAAMAIRILTQHEDVDRTEI